MTPAEAFAVGAVLAVIFAVIGLVAILLKIRSTEERGDWDGDE